MSTRAGISTEILISNLGTYAALALRKEVGCHTERSKIIAVPSPSRLRIRKLPP